MSGTTSPSVSDPEPTPFGDVLAANRAYAEGFDLAGLSGRASKGLAVVTCIDTRIEPLPMLGLVPGDAKIIRNAGARVSDDALRSLILATNLLGVDSVLVVQHTDCAMAKASQAEVAERIGSARGASAEAWEFMVMADQHQTLAADIQLIRECPLIGDHVTVGGFIYDVETGLLHPT